MRARETKSVLENVARLEHENASLREKIEEARARELVEETVRTRPVPPVGPGVRVAAAVSLGLVFGLVTLAFTLLLVPPGPHHHGHSTREVRGGSAGVCR